MTFYIPVQEVMAQSCLGCVADSNELRVDATLEERKARTILCFRLSGRPDTYEPPSCAARHVVWIEATDEAKAEYMVRQLNPDPSMTGDDYV